MSTITRLAPDQATPTLLEPEGPRPAKAGSRSPSYDADKAKILARLRRIEGQVRGITRMVEEDQYCVDILTQISAIVAALRGTGLLVLEDHIRGCVVGADPENLEGVLDELTGAIERFTKSVG
jgi:DNA-binding FrmR family transcriptional regulator